MKILHNFCLQFARHDGQGGKNQNENHATKMTKIPKKKRRKIWDERNICMKKIRMTKLNKMKRKILI